jgi:hypothetical protein
MLACFGANTTCGPGNMISFMLRPLYSRYPLDRKRGGWRVVQEHSTRKIRRFGVEICSRTMVPDETTVPTLTAVHSPALPRWDLPKSDPAAHCACLGILAAGK